MHKLVEMINVMKIIKSSVWTIFVYLTRGENLERGII